MKTINYAMTADYRKSWGAIEAVRELVQNCLDNRDNPSTYELSNGIMIITTPNYVLPMEVFALGTTTKSSKDIGGFGEGLKLALLILARLKLAPWVMSGENYFEPYFGPDELLNCDVFKIDVTPNEAATTNTTFCFNFPHQLLDELKQKINVFSDDILPLPNTVDILESRPGEIMVNGLFICNNDKFRYGYNFAPNNIELGCDRQVADTFGIAWATSQAWVDKLDASNKDQLLELLLSDCVDVAYFDHLVTERKAKLITEAFVERFGAVTIKKMGSSLSYGMSVGGGLYSTMTKSGYTQVTNQWAESGTPYMALVNFFESEKKHMRSRAQKEFVILLEASKDWKKK